MFGTPKHRQLSHAEVAQILEDFLTGRGTDWAWDDFVSAGQFTDKRLENIRQRCAGLWREFPPSHSSEYCSEQGRAVIWNYIRELKNDPSSIAE